MGATDVIPFTDWGCRYDECIEIARQWERELETN